MSSAAAGEEEEEEVEEVEAILHVRHALPPTAVLTLDSFPRATICYEEEEEEEQERMKGFPSSFSSLSLSHCG